MKSNNTETNDWRKIKRKIKTRALFQIMLITVFSMFILYLIFDVLFNDLIAEKVYITNHGFYYFCVMNKPLIVIICFSIILIGSTYYMISKISKYLQDVVYSIHGIIEKEEEIIQLPADLKEVEEELNEIKFTSLKNERKAKDAEQRKNDLIVYLAHDLKTPLTSIIGYLNLLEEATDMPKQQKEKYMSITLEKAYRLEELLNEFFEIARFNDETTVIVKKKLNVKLMLEQVSEEFYPIANEENKDIKIECENNLFIYADPNKISRVFNNLIKNAISYGSENTQIEISAKDTKESVEFIVKNEGAIIPKEKLSSIFEKFYRADSARTSKTGGSGLGLAIAKEIVTLHNGNIYAQSENGITKFIVELPKK